jgi:hypothetical protein
MTGLLWFLTIGLLGLGLGFIFLGIFIMEEFARIRESQRVQGAKVEQLTNRFYRKD